MSGKNKTPVCQHCSSKRVAKVSSKASDGHIVSIVAHDNCGINEAQGYLPNDLGLGGGDFCQFSYCLDCGMIQGKFPLEKTELEDYDPRHGYRRSVNFNW